LWFQVRPSTVRRSKCFPTSSPLATTTATSPGSCRRHTTRLAVTAVADFNGQPGGGAAPTCRSGVDDTPAGFSNFTGIVTADANHTIAAPGLCILSTWKGGGYQTISGTSMPSPHVAGAAALCIAAGTCAGNPAATIDQLRSDASVQGIGYGLTGDPDSPVGDRYYGYLIRASEY
jgi:subtilisin family serine protease